jgi:hypothetical protein
VPYVLTEVHDVASPVLPATCDGAVPEGRLWIVFGSAHCPECRELLRELRSTEASVREQGVEVIHYLTDVESCVSARSESSRSGNHSVGLAGFRTVNAWAVDRTPTTFFVDDGQVWSVLRGRAPVEVLLAEQRRIVDGGF